jgi:hypothetical protein
VNGKITTDLIYCKLQEWRRNDGGLIAYETRHCGSVRSDAVRTSASAQLFLNFFFILVSAPQFHHVQNLNL